MASPVEVVVPGLHVQVIAVTNDLSGVVVVVAGVVIDTETAIPKATVGIVNTMPTVDIVNTMPTVEAVSTVEAASTAETVPGFHSRRTDNHQTHGCDTCDCETFHNLISILVISVL